MVQVSVQDTTKESRVWCHRSYYTSHVNIYGIFIHAIKYILSL